MATVACLLQGCPCTAASIDTKWTRGYLGAGEDACVVSVICACQAWLC